MKYPAVLECIRVLVLHERPQILADDGTEPRDFEEIVKATICTLGFQITSGNDVVPVAPARSEIIGSNVNRRFGGRRKR